MTLEQRVERVTPLRPLIEAIEARISATWTDSLAEVAMSRTPALNEDPVKCCLVNKFPLFAHRETFFGIVAKKMKLRFNLDKRK